MALREKRSRNGQRTGVLGHQGLKRLHVKRGRLAGLDLQTRVGGILAPGALEPVGSKPRPGGSRRLGHIERKVGRLVIRIARLTIALFGVHEAQP